MPAPGPAPRTGLAGPPAGAVAPTRTEHGAPRVPRPVRRLARGTDGGRAPGARRPPGPGWGTARHGGPAADARHSAGPPGGPVVPPGSARAEGRPAPVAPGGRAATGAANSTDPWGSWGHRWHAANGRAPSPGASRSLAWAPRHPGPVRGGRKRFLRPGARAGARPGTATGPRYPRGHRPGRRVAGRARPALAPGGVRGRRYERGAAREAGGRRAVSGPEGSPTAPPPNRRPAPAWTAPSPQRDRSRSSLSHRCGNDLETRTKITVPRTRPPGSEFPGSARTPPHRVRTRLRGRTVRGPRTRSSETVPETVGDRSRDRRRPRTGSSGLRARGPRWRPPGPRADGRPGLRAPGPPRSDVPTALPAPGRRPRRPRTPHSPCGINHKS